MKQTQTQTRTKAFLNPEELLQSVPVQPDMVVADFGCGNGYYSVAAARLVGKKGQVYALDVLEEALSQTATLARLSGMPNISTRQCDLEKFRSCDLPDLSCDLVIIGSMFHQLKEKENCLREAYRVLKTGGRIVVVEWQQSTLFGPKERVDKKELAELLQKYSFRPVSDLPAGSFHYALLYNK